MHADQAVDSTRHDGYLFPRGLRAPQHLTRRLSDERCTVESTFAGDYEVGLCQSRIEPGTLEHPCGAAGDTGSSEKNEAGRQPAGGAAHRHRGELGMSSLSPELAEACETRHELRNLFGTSALLRAEHRG